jgi:hypothetical protein
MTENVLVGFVTTVLSVFRLQCFVLSDLDLRPSLPFGMSTKCLFTKFSGPSPNSTEFWLQCFPVNRCFDLDFLPCIVGNPRLVTQSSTSHHLEGGLFARNLPSNVSKTPDLRPKIREFFAIWGVPPPLSKFLDPPLIRRSIHLCWPILNKYLKITAILLRP